MIYPKPSSKQDGLFLRMNFLYLALLLFLLACNSNEQNTADSSKNAAEETVFQKGEHLFKINCIQCHMPAKDFAAPALAGVEKRWKSKELLYEFVKNSQAVIKKDTYAADLFEKWKQAPMLPFPHLTNADIDAIFEYCNSVANQQ